MKSVSEPAIPPFDTHFGGQLFQTHAGELARRIGKPWPPFAVLDVRSRAAFESGHVPGALHARPEALAERIPEGVPSDAELFVIGAGTEDLDRRRAALSLRRHGARRVVEVTGGMDEWNVRGLPLEPGGAARA